MTLVDTHHLDDVLTDLVSHHVLTPDQAHAVTDALAEEPAAPHPTPPLRARLVEAAAYLGAVLVVAGIVALVAQSWEDLTVTAHVVILVAGGVLAYAAGLAAVLAVGGGRTTIRQHAEAPRRRVASVLMTAGAVLVAAAVPAGVVVESQDPGTGATWPALVAGLIALALIVPAQLLSPSAVTELAMFGAGTFVVTQGLDLVTPARPEWDYINDSYPPVRAWDYLVPLVLVGLGLLWAGVVSRRLTLPVVAQVVGLYLALQSAIVLAADPPTRPGGVAVLGALAVLGIVVFVRSRSWPWLVLTVISVPVVVFVLVAEAGNPALAFLASGLVLLACAGGGALLGRRRRPPDLPVAA